MDSRNFAYMFYGFAAVWIILFGYLILLTARERRLRDQLERVKRMLEDRGQHR